jgi:mannan endo-1,4-beta-mannosidase
MARKVLTAGVIIAVLGVGAWLSVVLQRQDPVPRATAGNSGDGGGEEGEEQIPLAGEVKPLGRHRIYWGIFRFGSPYDLTKNQDVYDEVGRWPAIMMWYQEWAGRPLFDLRSAGWLLDRDIVPMVTWEPWRPPSQFGELVVDQPEYALRRIADGEFDSFIIQYASAIKEFRGPVMVRPFHEMDGFWYPWGGLVNTNTPQDFVEAWRRVHDIFENVGATNVTWVWSVNHLSVPDTAENAIGNYWPGDSYVDWIGISGFNWGDASEFSTWKTFDEVYADRYADLLPYRKPIVLTEVAAPEVGGDKASWIEESFDTLLARYPKIKAVVWYDKLDSELRDWRINSSPEALAAFREEISRSDVMSAPAALATATKPAAAEALD